MRIREFDTLRGFAILGVILVHVSALFVTLSPSVLTLFFSSLNLVSTVAIPLFFIISGTVLSFTSSQNTYAFYLRRMQSVIPPYLVFSLLAMLLFSSFSHLTENLLLGTSLFHLWFPILLLQLYFLFPLLQKYTSKNVLIIALLIQIAWNLTALFLPQGMLLLVWKRLFFDKLFYFMLGVFIGKNKGSFAIKKDGVLTLSTLLFLAVHRSFLISKFGTFALIPSPFLFIESVLEPLFVLGITSWLLRIAKEHPLPRIHTLGRYAFGIYLVHAFFHIWFANALMQAGLTIENVFFYLLLYLFTLVASFLTTYLLSRLPYSKWVIGKVPESS